MSNEAKDKEKKPLVPNKDHPAQSPTPNPFEELSQAAQKKSIFQRLGASFQDMIDTSRGPERPQEFVSDLPEPPVETADDIDMRRPKGVAPKRMIVPEGVIISGSITSSAETEISGRVDGDVTVDGRLYLGETALISGSVRAVSCRVEGLIEGKMECSQEIELGRTGRLNADAVAGRRITIAGQVFGNIGTGGLLRLVATGKIEGNIQIKQLVIEEGAIFNGMCSMRTPARRPEK